MLRFFRLKFFYFSRSNRTLRELIIPLFWYEESWQLSPTHQNHIKYFFVYPLKYQELAIFGLVGFGICLIGFGVLCLCCCYLLNKNKGNDLRKGDRPTKKSSGKVSPENVDDGSAILGQPSMMANGGAVPPIDDDNYDLNGYPMIQDDPNGNAIATYGNQWGTQVHGQAMPGASYGGYGGGYDETGNVGNSGGPYPPPPSNGGGYPGPDDMMDVEEQMVVMSGNQNYIDNANYVDDAETMMHMAAGNGGGQGPGPQYPRGFQGQGQTPTGLPMRMMSQQQQQMSMNGRYSNGYNQQAFPFQQMQNQQNQQGQPQYPLERLKRNMPAKQSASTYSMRTLQLQQQNQQMQQLGPQNQRQRWNEPPTQEEQMTMNDGMINYF